MVENMKGETVGSWKLMEKCLDHDLKGPLKWVLVVLCYHYPNIFPSEARIAKEAGIGLTAAKGAIKYLESKDWITRERRYSKSTVYTVNVARIMATPPRRLRIPAVEGGLPFPGPEADRTPQPSETAGIRLSEPPQTAGIRPINSRNPATNRQDNKQVLTDNRDKPEKASKQEHVKTPCAQQDNIASTPLEAEMLAPNTESTNAEVEHPTRSYDWIIAESEEATVTSLPAPSPTSPSTPSPASEPEKKDKASTAPAPSASKPPALPLPANWQVAQEPTGRWVVLEVSADGKSSMPIGFGRTTEAAIADARATMKRAASFRAKWNKADPWE
jgi:hypothetical protein